MSWIIAIPALPAVAFIATVIMPRTLRNKSLWIPLGAVIASTLIAVVALYQTALATPLANEVALWQDAFRIATFSDSAIEVSLRIDALSSVLALVVAIVGLCVQIFSLGYMKDDARKGWYFSLVSLFTAAMLTFVLANDMILLFVSWEIMGLCSYFLIGFWFEEDEPRFASQKAFIVTRIGDLGFFFALMVVFRQVGSFDLTSVLASVEYWEPGVAIAVASGLLLAAIGKSAQLPLHVWLPDAMAGPTPASALIHAATMVASGVLLIVFTMPIFYAAPVVLTITLGIGLATSLIAGLIACVQNDIKKVLAYSTISQIGLMFAALGVGSIPAAVFHLTTHAFFKALLFLAAGSVIHAVHTQDMREMGGLRKKLPATWITFLVGLLALAGLPPLAGFFSKDEIVLSFLHAHMEWGAIIIFALSALTAFYSARLYFQVFEGMPKHKKSHESGIAMVGPLVLLGIFSLGVGWLGPTFMQFVGYEGEWPSLALVAISLVVVGLGFVLAWWRYGRNKGAIAQSAREKDSRNFFITALENKMYFDLAFDKVFVRPFNFLAEKLAMFDRVGIDGIVNGAATLSCWAGERIRKIQNGKLQSYQRMIVSAAVFFIIALTVVFFVINNGQG